MPDQTPEDIVKGISAAMTEMKENNVKMNASFKEIAEKAGDDAQAAVKTAEKLAQSQEGLSTSICELEQKLADSVVRGKAPIETLGQMIIKSDEFKAFANGSSERMTVNANTITGQEGSPPENADTLVQPQRLAGIVPGAFRSLKARDLILPGRTNSNAIEYTRELAFTNSAAETAEGVTKPESVLTYELVTENVRTVAHWLKVSKQILDDSAALASHIDTRLRYGVDVRIDNQIINGDGTGQNLSGMVLPVNSTAFTPTTGENQLDTLNRMIEAVTVADYMASGVILNPADWHNIERLKVGASDDRYIIGDPSRMGAAVLWGLPVAVSNNVAAGNALVAAFDMAYQFFDRDDTTVSMYEQDETNVQQNLLTVRAEARGALASYVPAAAQYGALSI